MRLLRASYFTHVEAQGGEMTSRTFAHVIGGAKISKRSPLFCPYNRVPSFDAIQKKQ